MMTRNKKVAAVRWLGRILSLAVLALLAGGRAEASLETDAGGFPLPLTIVTFEQFAGMGPGYTAGPVDVGGLLGEVITFIHTDPAASNSGFGAVLGQSPYGLGENGEWGADDKTYAGLDAPEASMIFTFATPVAAVGGFVNYDPPDVDPEPDPILTALGAGNVVLESYNLETMAPINTPAGVNDGAFRGILRASNDIVAFQLSNNFIVIDDLTFGRVGAAVVPEPGSLCLLAAGLLGLVGYTWRRR